MSATGQNTTAPNLSTFLSALILGGIVAGVYVTLFFVLHSRSERVFQPRANGPESKRPHKLPLNALSWFWGILRTPDTEICRLNGLDAYFFVRFIRTMAVLLIPYWVLTWAILMPLTAISPNNGLPDLNKFTFGNVSVPHRLGAHIAVGIALILLTLHILYREYHYYFQFRARYLASPEYAALQRSKNVMLANLPAEWDTPEKLREATAPMDITGIQDVWFVYNTKPLDVVYDERNKEIATLEQGIVNAEKIAAKNVKNGTVPASPKDEEAADADPVSKYIETKDRPTHKLGFLGLFDKKVDSLEYGPTTIVAQNEKLQTMRKQWMEYPRIHSAFMRFEDAATADRFAAEAATTLKRRNLIARADVVPEDIIWANLAISPAARRVRWLISWALTFFLIIIWAPLVAFVGFVSNVSNLCSTLSFLKWICKLPPAVIGIIQGILPPVLLIVLFILLPIFLRIFVKIGGEPRHSIVELKLWSRFWLFQIIHGFLIVAIASGLLAALQNISQTLPQLPDNLATSLPTSSIFFLTYILTATLGSTTSTMSRAVPFVLTKLAFILRGGTPRKAYAYDYGFGSIPLATAWPPVALLAVIGIVYTAAQPIILGFAAVGYCLVYVTFKYLFIWVVEQPASLETGGRFYPRALGAIFAGLYVEEIFMCALFFLKKSTMGFIGGGIFGGALLLTILVHLYCIAVAWRAERPDPTIVEKLKKGGIVTAILAGCESDTRLSLRGGEHAFEPPSVWRDPIVWVPDDAQGIGRSEVAKLEAVGIHAAVGGSTMTEEGRTEVEQTTEGFPEEEI